MPITLKGIRLDSLTLQRKETTNKLELTTATYCLISSTDVILASQSIGGYGDKVTVTPSFETLTLLDKFVENYKKDLNTVLGLDV